MVHDLGEGEREGEEGAEEGRGEGGRDLKSVGSSDKRYLVVHSTSTVSMASLLVYYVVSSSHNIMIIVPVNPGTMPSTARLAST